MLGALAYLASAYASLAAVEPTPAAAPPAKGGSTEVVLRFLQERVRNDPDDNTAWNRLGDLYLEKLRRTGSMDYLAQAASAAEESLRSVPAEQNYGGVALRARVAQASHQFASARDDGVLLTQLAPDRADSWRTLGNALLELGDYEKAADAWRQMKELEPVSYATETCLSREALVHGDREAARKHLGTALALAQQASEPDSDHLAWCRVLLGQLAFSSGDWETAEKEYQAALALDPGSYLVLEHQAELAAARQHGEQAVKMYRQVLELAPRPEFFQAVGDVFTAMKKPDEAKECYNKALAGYLAGATGKNAHYYHHLAGFYSDSLPNPAEAVQWAKKDLEIRHSVFAWDALGWALWQAGDYPGALEAEKKALALGTRDAHLLYHAGMIFMSAGEVAQGKKYLLEAVAVNPRYNSFHVHR